jgi:excisionase family DNA binding protein
MGTGKKNELKDQVVRSGQRISNPLPRLMTIKQASDYLGLTTWAVRERIWNGQLPVLQFPGGRKQYLDRNDLESFIERNKRIVL